MFKPAYKILDKTMLKTSLKSKYFPYLCLRESHNFIWKVTVRHNLLSQFRLVFQVNACKNGFQGRVAP